MSTSTQTPSADQLLNRGVAQVLPAKDSLIKLMASRPIKLYLGIDPTGAFLHLGHMVVLRKLQQFAEAGHQVILLIGNGTVKIGDPTGRDSARPVLTDEQIEANFQDWKAQASKILDFSKITIMRNGDWLDKLTYTDLVKLLAKTTVQQLIERDMFQERLKKQLPIFGHEILYPMLQGYDSVAMDVDLEIGGTDQTFNMMMGRQLQQIYHQKEKWVLATPIINGLDGRKMSKSFNNFVALTEPANTIYSKLMQLPDEQIVEYFTLLTNVSVAEIADISAQMRNGANPMKFKKQLALNITTQLHDAAQAATAAATFQSLVQEKSIPIDLPVITTTQAQLSVLELVKLAAPDLSNSDIKRLCQQNSLSLFTSEHATANKLTDYQAMIQIPTPSAEPLKLKVGKKRWFAISQA